MLSFRFMFYGKTEEMTFHVLETFHVGGKLSHATQSTKRGCENTSLTFSGSHDLFSLRLYFSIKSSIKPLVVVYQLEFHIFVSTWNTEHRKKRDGYKMVKISP
jgi:hypothetical protein